MAMLEFHIRRQVRALIDEELEKIDRTLQQNTIENLVNDRIVELAKQDASGIRTPVNWTFRVAGAVAGEAQDKKDLQAITSKMQARGPVIKPEE